MRAGRLDGLSDGARARHIANRRANLVPALQQRCHAPAAEETGPAGHEHRPTWISHGTDATPERRRRGHRSRFREPPSAPDPKVCRRAWWRALHPVASLFAASEPRLGATFQAAAAASRGVWRRSRIVRVFRVHGEPYAADGMDAIAAARHVQPLGHTDRSRVLGVDDRDDLAQLEVLE